MQKDFYQIHSLFKDFMVNKGYAVKEREKFISPIFPTTFTMSGGPDLAYKFWQGDKSLQGNQIVNQPCIRHWDIELTGDGKHLSFFNMFVADSIDGYSRKELIMHFIEFFTNYLGLEPSRFYASYFGGGNIKGTYFKPDDEMKQIWQDAGFNESKIIAFGDAFGMEAFVANSIEPVGGPRAELFYDLRDDQRKINSSQEFFELEKQGKFLEFFTHVLYNVEVQSNKQTLNTNPEFNFKNMDKQAIAAGFGPQRILRILEGVQDIGDISLFDYLKCELGEMPRQFHKETTIVTDHIRGIVFLINDGVLELRVKKNTSRKYIFRKYFKHFKENFDKLPLENRSLTLKDITAQAIEMFGALFPEFIQNREIIIEKVQQTYLKFENNKVIQGG